MTPHEALRVRCEQWLTDNEVECRDDGVHYEFQIVGLMNLLAAERAAEAEVCAKVVANSFPFCATDGEMWVLDQLLKASKLCEARAVKWREKGAG